MRYDIDEISKKMYKNQTAVKPSYALNQETQQKMKEYCEMDKGKSKFKLNRLAKVAVICCSVCLLATISVPAYNAIKKVFPRAYKWEAGIEFGEGEETTMVKITDEVPCRKLPDDFPKERMVITSIKSLEEDLGFSLLDSKDNPDEELRWDAELNKDGSLACVFVYRPYYVVLGEYDSITMDIRIFNEGADAGYIAAVEDSGGDAMSNKEFVTKVYSEKLDTDIIIYKSGGGDGLEPNIRAVFQYDSIFYTLSSHAITEAEMIEFVKELE